MMTSRQPGTIREAYAEASSFLAERGAADAASNAEVLLQHLLGMDRTAFLLRLTDPFPAGKFELWQSMLERKAAGEPAQYIIGEQEFYGLPFQVTSAVLIPRPETELLVERMIRRGRELWPDGCPLAADVGTGSGAIPVTLAVNCPAWRLAASDISPPALEVARSNAERNGVGGRIEFFCGDLLVPYAERGLAPDILVSNPPYIPTGDIAGLQPEVKTYEPMTALDGGPDGLDLYRRLVEQMSRLGKYPALVGFEVGMGQADAVSRMLEETGRWRSHEIVRDLAGIDRHVVAFGLN